MRVPSLETIPVGASSSNGSMEPSLREYRPLPEGNDLEKGNYLEEGSALEEHSYRPRHAPTRSTGRKWIRIAWKGKHRPLNHLNKLSIRHSTKGCRAQSESLKRRGRPQPNVSSSIRR